MNKIEFIPLGTIVIIKGVMKKVMIAQRAVNVLQPDESTKYFEYGAVLYPEGLVDDSLIYFNNEDIAKIVFEGYMDEDNEMMVEQINEAIDKQSDEINLEDPFANLREVDEGEK